MKKLLLILVPALFVVTLGGAVWWRYGRGGDPYAQAQQLINKGDLAGAQLELRNVVRNQPQNAAAHFRLGQVQLRLGDPVAAGKELTAARDLGFDARTVSPLLAQTYMAQGQYRELLRDFPVQGLPPDQAASLLVLRALAQLSIGDQNAAQASAAEAERLAPQSVDAEVASARVAIAKNDFVTAEQKVDRAMQLNPRSPDTLLLKGQLQNLRGDRTRALESFDSALQLNPNLLAARLERANVLLINGDDKRALDDVNAALKIEPKSAMGVYMKSTLEAKSGDYTDADTGLTTIAPLLARFPRGYYLLAVTKYNLGQAEQASDAATHFLAHNPNDPDAIKLFVRIELAQRRSARAIDVLNKALSAGSTDPEMLDLLGRAYALAGSPAQAVQAFQRAAALAPDNADILTRLASARMTMGDSATAANELEHALQIAPSQPGAGEALVAAAISSGDIDKAVLALDRLHKAQGDTEIVGDLTALIKMAQLDLDGAAATLNDVIKRYPTAVQARIDLAKVLTAQDHPVDAQKVLTDVLARDPANSQALNSMVTLLLADHKLADATKLLEGAHDAAPKNTDVSVALINLYARGGDASKALILLDGSLKDLPDNPILLDAKARTLLALGKAPDARTIYRHMLDLTPTDVTTRRVLSDQLISIGDGAGAKKLIGDGLKEQPGNATLLQTDVAVALKVDGLDAALALADRLSQDPINLPAALTLRGDLYMASARFADAAASYAAAQKSAPSTLILLRVVGALNAQGQLEQASQVLRDWLGNHPGDIDAASALASMDIQSRRFFDAEAHLNIVLAKQPSNPDALNNLAWVYQQRDDARAQGVAQKSYLISPTPQAADTLGWILTTTGKPASAVALLRQASAQLSGDPTVQYHLAEALRQTGHADEAIPILRGIVSGLLDFDDKPAAQKALADLTGAK